MAIPKELYEAAEADGAGANARFWHITLPLLKPVLAVVVLFSTIFTFSDFNIVYVLTHGGPINSTHLFATLSRMIGIDTGRIGEGAAISLYLFPLLVFVVWAQLRFVRKQTFCDWRARRRAGSPGGRSEAICCWCRSWSSRCSPSIT